MNTMLPWRKEKDWKAALKENYNRDWGAALTQNAMYKEPYGNRVKRFLGSLHPKTIEISSVPVVYPPHLSDSKYKT
jgi:hypothetical protein